MAQTILKYLICAIVAVLLAENVECGLELISCQPGFTGEFVPELKQAVATCSPKNLSMICNNHCMASELKIITTEGLDIGNIGKLMAKQLAGPQGKQNAQKLFFGIQECNEFSSQLAMPCDFQVDFWQCMDKALACPPPPQA